LTEEDHARRLDHLHEGPRDVVGYRRELNAISDMTEMNGESSRVTSRRLALIF
jgi:hypothetical protein